MYEENERPWWRPGELHLQGTLDGFVEPAVDGSFARMRRIQLNERAWIDHQDAWLVGDQVVLDRLILELAWQQRIVDGWGRPLEPRLKSWWKADEGPEALPVLGAMRRSLSARYREAFDSIGFTCYRRGDDSVGWHRDRDEADDPVVAIVSVGAPRPFQLRAVDGGKSRSFALGNGDLLVMGGACQSTWEHRVPKVRRAEPRVSIVFRHRSVRHPGVPDPTAIPTCASVGTSSS